MKIDINNREKWVGLIGSRNASQDELDETYNLGKYLASKGYIVVSGLAIGIDAAGHKGAIDSGGLTVAIVNTPPNKQIYPKENIKLAEEIINKNGLIIHPFTSECSYDNSEKPSHFTKRLLERDRLLGFLCPKIVAVCDKDVIEGGTRYAVKYGMEYGNEVYRYSSNKKYYKNPKHTYCNIGWTMELNIEKWLSETKTIENNHMW